MIRKLGLALALVTGLVLVVLLAILLPAHWQVRQAAPPLPTADALAALSGVDGGPVAVS